MQRTVIEIDEEFCNGCRQCVDACHEGAIVMKDGKATLVADIYCDGLGDCIGECPTGAITKVVREADAYDQTAVDRRLAELRAAGQAPRAAGHGGHGGCPGAAMQQFAPSAPAPGQHGGGCPGAAMRQFAAPAAAPPAPAEANGPIQSQLRQWPVQLRLVPPDAPFLANADVVVCADCAPFAVPDFHQRYLADKVVVVACPKLDPSEANAQRLEALMVRSQLRSLTILRMEVPCCAGLAQQAVAAWNAHRRDIPCQVHVIGIRGGIEVQTMVPAPA